VGWLGLKELGVFVELKEFQMPEEIQKWEYRVLTIGSIFGTKDDVK